MTGEQGEEFIGEEVMTVYCDRQARLPKRPKARWFIYTLQAAGPRDDADLP